MLQPAPNLIKDSEPRSYKQKLYDLWDATGFKPQELIDHPEEPPHYAYVWEWFFDFCSPITWPDVKAWAWASGIKPTRWESELLIRLDNLRK